MSTHYGNMIHMDDRTVMFGNLEDAAEFIGDMLPPEVTQITAPHRVGSPRKPAWTPDPVARPTLVTRAAVETPSS